MYKLMSQMSQFGTSRVANVSIWDFALRFQCPSLRDIGKKWASCHAQHGMQIITRLEAQDDLEVEVDESSDEDDDM